MKLRVLARSAQSAWRPYSEQACGWSPPKPERLVAAQRRPLGARNPTLECVAWEGIDVHRRDAAELHVRKFAVRATGYEVPSDGRSPRVLRDPAVRG